jgi:hypothetical protein
MSSSKTVSNRRFESIFDAIMRPSVSFYLALFTNVLFVEVEVHLIRKPHWFPSYFQLILLGLPLIAFLWEFCRSLLERRVISNIEAINWVVINGLQLAINSYVKDLPFEMTPPEWEEFRERMVRIEILMRHGKPVKPLSGEWS